MHTTNRLNICGSLKGCKEKKTFIAFLFIFFHPRNVHQSLGGSKGRNKQALKYTAARLMEKGVLLEVEDLPECQQKNLLFEITPLATTGVFHIQAKLMGVTMENVEIDIQVREVYPVHVRKDKKVFEQLVQVERMVLSRTEVELVREGFECVIWIFYLIIIDKKIF